MRLGRKGKTGERKDETRESGKRKTKERKGKGGKHELRNTNSILPPVIPLTLEVEKALSKYPAVSSSVSRTC